ncbi:MAG: S8 family serine peptidase [Lachnospiraceae bacterium]|nr:S8 family serine peptidase [Lachnospiraceae bacterium]
MEILIIDSGVSKGHPKIPDALVGYSLIYDEEKNEIMRVDDFEDESGHGTAVFNIVDNIVKNNNDIKIKVIKIFDEELSISEEELYMALDYIYENEEPDLINLSLGLNVCENIARFYTLCEKFVKKNITLVSAFDNAGAISFPAAFDNVIGIDSSSHLQKQSEFEYIEGSIVNIRAKGGIMRLAWLKPNYIVTGGNSFSCAIMSGLIANYIYNENRNRRMDIRAVMGLLKEKAIKVYEPLAGHNAEPFPMPQIKKAVVFPFNKEMHAIIRFHYLIEFEIAGIYDVKYSGRVGTNTCRILMDDNVKDIKVRDISEINWDEFDTLIIGHLDELTNLTNGEQLRTQLLDKAVELGKNVYSFDPINENTKEPNIYYPNKSIQDVPANRFGKLYNISKPVLGIFGTSSRQGKFTLQLILRDKLQQQGYRVGQLGSEPNSLLFGMDDIFPFGYNGTVQLEGYESITLLNQIMFEISQKENDIILVGSQSGTVPYDSGNLMQYPIYQMFFLYGTMPDGIILNVNPFDEMEYIENTVKFIEGATSGKVIAFCIFPMKIKDNFAGFTGAKERITEDEEQTMINELLRIFSRPAYILGKEKDMNALVETVQNFFGGEEEPDLNSHKSERNVS